VNVLFGLYKLSINNLSLIKVKFMKKWMLILSCLFLSIGFSIAQTTRISGTVVDDTGESVIGASVVVKGSTTGTITDADGRFTINTPQANSPLVFSLIGMKTREVRASQNMRIVLESDAELLDEVMVVAYGTVKKSAFTGAAGVVDSKSITKLQVSSVSKALEGAVPGLQAASISGQPGSGATLRVRGYGSISAGNSPLIVLDGTAYDGSLSALNTQDIESITVLKDAASAALYGSRAANGVIMITTKKGTQGKPKVTLDVRQGINVRGAAFYDTFDDPGTYLETLWQALYNDDKYSATPTGNPGSYASENLGTLISGYNPYLNVANNQIVGTDGKLASGLTRRYNDDWVDELYRTGYRQEYNVNISSGGDRYTSFLSFGFLDDKGIVDETGYKRFSGRANVSFDLTNNLKVSGSLSYARTDQDAPKTSSTSAAANPFNSANFIPPIYPVYVYDMDGNVMRDKDGNKLFDYGQKEMPGTETRPYNPGQNSVADAKLDKREVISDNIGARGTVEYAFLENFKASANLGYDVVDSKQNTYYNKYYGDAVDLGGRILKYFNRTESMTFNQTLNYNRTFNKVHNLSLLAGHEYYQYKYSRTYVQKTNVFVDGVIDFDNATKMNAMESYSQKKTIDSYFSQALYDYDGKYYFSASFRRDGSSIFHKDNRWGNFWSIGGSWRISQEDFFEVSEIDNLRLRASYGTSGNDQMLDEDGYFNYMPYKDQYKLDSSGGLTKVYKGNQDLKWETNKNFNLGFDLSMFSNRLNVEFDFYTRNASDLLYNKPLAPSSGDAYQPMNVGSVRNTGIEFTISGDVIKTSDFRWNVSFSGNHNKNKITKLYDGKDIAKSTRILSVGGSILDFYLLEYAGVDENTGMALWYYPDPVTGEKVTTDVSSTATANGGRVNKGTALPDFNGTLNLTFEYKGFDLGIMSTFQLGGQVLDYTYASLMGGGSAATNWHKDIKNAWSETNTSSNIPRLGTSYRDGNAISDRFLTDASYFNLRNITLGYTFNKNQLKFLNASSLRIFVVGDNLALASKRKGLDPRQALTSGVDGLSQISGRTEVAYTPIRSYSIGLNLNF